MVLRSSICSNVANRAIFEHPVTRKACALSLPPVPATGTSMNPKGGRYEDHCAFDGCNRDFRAGTIRSVVGRWRVTNPTVFSGQVLYRYRSVSVF